ncbi:M6 family metalloprotease domain-containing protein [Barnesiella propionica]|uniref:M6 family metalloprotease domain-containing protein n=1 Tax=Barnesiella propionica TaxID=2981781 RepID=UPI0011C8563D|nr:M6 family metalloprotease domain-containing protein [Barnesiella propionica]MCU6769680.1 M6 family metalloprotease domain-containing protein [Barnesiella propionica]
MKIKKLLLLFISLLLAGSNVLLAVPAKRTPITAEQPDGSTITILLHGDEFHHYTTTTDGVVIAPAEDGYYHYMGYDTQGMSFISNRIAKDAINRSADDAAYIETLQTEKLINSFVEKNSQRRQSKAKNINRIAPMKASSTGNVEGLVLMVEFSDKKFSANGTNAAIDELMNKEGFNKNNAIGSARDYFISQSGGKFTPHFNVVGPIKLDKTMAYYGGNNDANAHEMIIDACRIASEQNLVDFSEYDNNNDGFVDLVYVIYAGYSEAAGAPANTVWPHAWYIYQGAGQIVSVNGVKLDAYACSSELNGTSGTVLDGIGTFCHEFSHTLGLPDFYDTRSNGTNFGMDVWSLMDYGCYNVGGNVPLGYSAYEREFVGWLDIEELQNPKTISLEYIAESQQAYKITSTNANQYFILENRQKKDWDKGMPASGLMITKVDYNQSAWDNNVVNNTTNRQRLQIVPADGVLSSATVSRDLYPYGNNTSFTETSSPNQKIYQTLISGKPVTEIAQENGIITFKFMGGGILSPEPSAATDITKTGFTAHWNAVEEATSYSLLIDQLALPKLKENFTKFEDGTINAPDKTDLTENDELNKFMEQTGWTGKSVFQAGNACQIGQASESGNLQTPPIDLSGNDGVYTITIQACKNSMSATKILNITVNGERKTLSLTDDMQEYKIIMDNGTQNTVIAFSVPASNRAIIKEITIHSGDITSNSDNTDDKYPMTINGIQGTSYDVTGLESNYLYTYQVKAVKNDTEESIWSKPVSVTISGNSSVCKPAIAADKIYTKGNTLFIDSNEDYPVQIYNLSGIMIRETTANPGINKFILDIPGVYLIRCGETVVKVIITK